MVVDEVQEVVGDVMEDAVEGVGEVGPVVELGEVVMEEAMEVVVEPVVVVEVAGMVVEADAAVEVAGMVVEEDAVVEVAEMAVEDSYTILAQKITLECRESDLVVLEFFQISSELEYMVNKLDTLRYLGKATFCVYSCKNKSKVGEKLDIYLSPCFILIVSLY